MHMKLYCYLTPHPGCLKHRPRTEFQLGTLFKMDLTKGMTCHFFMGRHVLFFRFPTLSSEFLEGLLKKKTSTINGNTCGKHEYAMSTFISWLMTIIPQRNTKWSTSVDGVGNADPDDTLNMPSKLNCLFQRCDLVFKPLNWFSQVIRLACIKAWAPFFYFNSLSFNLYSFLTSWG